MATHPHDDQHHDELRDEQHRDQQGLEHRDGPRGIDRRHFLGALGAGAAIAAVPGVAGAASRRTVRVGRRTRTTTTSTSPSTTARTTPASSTTTSASPATKPAASNGDGILVLVTLYGGNDGLNTVIPTADTAYAAGRGTLAYTPDQTLALDTSHGLNAAMPGIKALWDARQVAIVQGVGYPNPDRSHFRSMDIWQSGVPERFEGTGWLGRWNDRAGANPLQLVSLGASVPRMLLGERSSAAAIPGGKLDLPGSNALANAYARMVAADAATTLGPWGGAIADAGADLLRAQATYQPLLGANATDATGSTSLEGTTPSTAFAQELTLVASLIKGGAPARAYSVSLGGFDTHAEEKTGHERLLATLDDGIARFSAALRDSARGAKVTVLVVTEFGRRVAANGSGGTDHGTATPVFAIGRSVKGGFHGDMPSLTDLDQGDLKYTTDFRSVYATVLGSTLGIDPKDVLGAGTSGKGFAPVPFL